MEAATPPGGTGTAVGAPPDRIERRKRALERELETNMTLKMTSPQDTVDAASRSRYGRARKQKTDEDFYPSNKTFPKPLKAASVASTPGTPNKESQSLSPHRVYKMNASKSPVKFPLETLKSENPSANLIQGLLEQNKCLSRFADKPKTVNSPGKTEKIYVQKDLIQRREEKTASIMKNMFSPLKSPMKSPHNSSHLNSILERSVTENKNISPRQASLFEHPSVIKTLNFNEQTSPMKPTKAKEEFTQKKLVTKSPKSTTISSSTPKKTKSKTMEEVDGQKKAARTPVKAVHMPQTESSQVESSQEEIDYVAIELNCAYQENDLAWARVGSYPFWPCLVTRDPFSGLVVKQKGLAKSRKLDIIHVTFLGDNGRRGWIHENMLRVYQGIDEFLTSREQLTPEQKKRDSKLCAAFTVSEKHRKTWDIAVKEAEMLLGRPKETRIDLLYEIVYGPSRKPEVKAKKEKTIKIEKVDKGMSLSESLFEGLFSGNDSKTDDKDKLDVSDVVTACLDDMVIKTGNIMIQKQSHMDIWLQKAKSKTPEKVHDNLILVMSKRNKKRRVQSDDSDVSVKNQNVKKRTTRTSKDVKVENSSGVDSGDSKRNSIKDIMKLKGTRKSKVKKSAEVTGTKTESIFVDTKILVNECTTNENIEKDSACVQNACLKIAETSKEELSNNHHIRNIKTTIVITSDTVEAETNSEETSENKPVLIISKIEERPDELVNGQSQSHILDGRAQLQIVKFSDTIENKNNKFDGHTEIDVPKNDHFDYEGHIKNKDDAKSDATLKNKFKKYEENVSKSDTTDHNILHKEHKVQKSIGMHCVLNTEEEPKSEKTCKELNDHISLLTKLEQNKYIDKTRQNNIVAETQKESTDRHVQEDEASFNNLKYNKNTNENQEKGICSPVQKEAIVYFDKIEETKYLGENQGKSTYSPNNKQGTNIHIDEIEETNIFIENQKKTLCSPVKQQETKIHVDDIKESNILVKNQEQCMSSPVQLQEANMHIDVIEETKYLDQSQGNSTSCPIPKERTNIQIDESEGSKNLYENQEQSMSSPVQLQEANFHIDEIKETINLGKIREQSICSSIQQKEANAHIDEIKETKILGENDEKAMCSSLQQVANVHVDEIDGSKKFGENQEKTTFNSIQQQKAIVDIDKIEETKNLCENQIRSTWSQFQKQGTNIHIDEIDESKNIDDNQKQRMCGPVQLQESNVHIDEIEETIFLVERPEKSTFSPLKQQEAKMHIDEIEKTKTLRDNVDNSSHVQQLEANIDNTKIEENEEISEEQGKNTCSPVLQQKTNVHIEEIEETKNLSETEGKRTCSPIEKERTNIHIDKIEETNILVENQKQNMSSPVQLQEANMHIDEIEDTNILFERPEKSTCSPVQQQEAKMHIDEIDKTKTLSGNLDNSSHVQQLEANIDNTKIDENEEISEEQGKNTCSLQKLTMSITRDLVDNKTLIQNNESIKCSTLQEQGQINLIGALITEQEKNTSSHIQEQKEIRIIKVLGQNKNLLQNIEKSRSVPKQERISFTEEDQTKSSPVLENVNIRTLGKDPKHKILENPSNRQLNNDDDEEISLRFSEDDDDEKTFPDIIKAEDKEINGDEIDDEVMESLYISEDEVSNSSPINRRKTKKMCALILASDTNSSDSEITFAPKPKTNAKYEDPIFLEYARMRQEQVMDENPDMTEIEILAFLYNNWFYEEGLKTDAMKSHALEESIMIKGLGDGPVPKKTRKKRMNKQTETDKDSKAKMKNNKDSNEEEPEEFHSQKRILRQRINKAQENEVSLENNSQSVLKQNHTDEVEIPINPEDNTGTYKKKPTKKGEPMEYAYQKRILRSRIYDKMPNETSVESHYELLLNQSDQITMPEENMITTIDKGTVEETMKLEYQKRSLHQKTYKGHDNEQNEIFSVSSGCFLSQQNLEITRTLDENQSMYRKKASNEEELTKIDYQESTLGHRNDTTKDNKTSEVESISLSKQNSDIIEPSEQNRSAVPENCKIDYTDRDLMQECVIDDTDDEIESPSYEELSNDGSKFPSYEKTKDKVILLEAFDSSFTSVESANLMEEKITEELIRKATQNRLLEFDNTSTLMDTNINTIMIKSDENLSTSTPKHNRRKRKNHKSVSIDDLESGITITVKKEYSNTPNDVASRTNFEIEDSEGNNTPKRSLRKRNHIKLEKFDKDVSINYLESATSSDTDSEAPPISAYMKRKTEMNKSKYDDPNFLKYAEVKQDIIMDENPDLTQEEIMSFLYNTWLYEECEKTEADKNNDNIDTNIVKGLVGFAPVRSKKERKKKMKTIKIEEEEIFIPKDKPARKATIKSYFNESDSDSDFSKYKKTADAKVSEVITIDSESEVIDVERLNAELDAFLTDMIKPKPNVFRGFFRESLCEICEKPGCIIKCRGHCGGMYHMDCVKKQVAPKPDKSPKRKRKSGRRKRTTESDQSQEDSRLLNDDSESDDKSQLNECIERVLETTPLVIDNAENFESLLAIKMKELLEKAPDDDRSMYSTDDELEWHRTGTGQCEIVDVIPKIRNSDPEINASNFKCNDCQNYELSPCFVCKSTVSPKQKTEIRQRCSIIHCHKVYHLECLETWPQTQLNSGAPTKKSQLISEHSEPLTCPRHVCHTCVCDDPRGCKTRFSPDRLAQCVRCPAVYHTFTRCLPAGTQILNASNIICPRHFETSRVPHHVNTSWCFICATGGSLICCEYCPMSFHADCLNIMPPEDGYMCEDCETGRLPLYGEMVWVKLGYYRWWPGVILHPYQVPSNILALRHATGEFVVRFLGANDHFWMYRGRVFPYQEGDTGKAGNQRSKLDAEFTLAVEQAQYAYNVLKNHRQENVEETEDIAASLLPPSYSKLRVNKPTGSLLSRRAEPYEEGSSTQCDCRAGDPDPCGPDTQCLNRVLLTECGPNCQTGDRCNNRHFERRLYPKLAPRRVAHRGWGLYTLEDIKKGQFVIEYVGELIDGAEFRRRMGRKHEVRDENYYFLTLDKDRMIDAGPKGNAARFMNHCCEPNCETQKWTVLGDIRVGLFAICDIPANNEVTFNYNLECASMDKKRCFCGTKRCSGYIGAKPKQEEVQPKRIKNIDKKTGKRKYTKKAPVPSPLLAKKTEVRKYRTTINSITSAAKSKQLTELEQDLEIIRNAAIGIASDTESNEFADKVGDNDNDKHTDEVDKKPDVELKVDNVQETDEVLDVTKSVGDVERKLNSDKKETDNSIHRHNDETKANSKRKNDKKWIDDYFIPSNVGKDKFSSLEDVDDSLSDDRNNERKDNHNVREKCFDLDKPSTSKSFENVSVSTVKKNENHSKINEVDGKETVVKVKNNLSANDVDGTKDGENVNADTVGRRSSYDSQNGVEGTIKRTLILKINDCLVNGHDDKMGNNITINNLKQNGIKVNGLSNRDPKAVNGAEKVTDGKKVLKVAMERCQLIAKKEPKSSLRDSQKPLKRKRVSFSTEEIIIGYDNSVMSPVQKKAKWNTCTSPDGTASSSYESEFCEFLKRSGGQGDANTNK